MSKTEKTVVHVGGGGGLFTLFLVFLVLKLTGVIAWSWWWVTAPLWGPFALVAVIGGGVVAVMGLALLGTFIWSLFDK